MTQRARHADVAVDADHAERHDGRRAAKHVHGGPHAAEDPPERPAVEHQQAGGEGQHGGAEQQVGHRQVGDEVVRGAAQVRVDEDGEQHQHVAADRHQGDAAEDGSDDDGVRHRSGRRLRHAHGAAVRRRPGVGTAATAGVRHR